jgi:hypothetical protein
MTRNREGEGNEGLWWCCRDVSGLSDSPSFPGQYLGRAPRLRPVSFAESASFFRQSNNAGKGGKGVLQDEREDGVALSQIVLLVELP